MRDDRLRLSRRAAGAGIAVLLLFGTTACERLAEVPVLSESNAKSDATLSELREWVGEEIDAVIEVTGVKREWGLGGTSELKWVEDRERIFEVSHLPNCTYETGKVNPASVRIDLITDPLDQDPFLLLERVRNLWIERGWEVGNLPGSGQGQSQILTIRADREDGAMATLSAGDAAGGKMLGLMVSSACSNDPSVAR